MLGPLLLVLATQDTPTETPEGPSALEIGAAAELLGEHFTEAELELMRADVLERRAEAERLRAVPLSNDVAPVLYFLPNPMAAQGDEEFKTRRGATVRLPHRPTAREELPFADISTLGQMLRHHDVTCVELAELFLERIERLDDQLHFLVTPLRERAMAQARQLDEELAAGKPRGPLHGIPWVAKDLLAVKGAPTTWGTPPFREQEIDHDAAVVERLDAAGAVLLAKVSLGELAWGDVWFGGQTRNPWDPEQGSSGSSAGSASAVAAGCVPFAIGSETYGSIVSPSDRCGNTSLRPTFGAVSRFGAMTLCWSLDKLGPICRSAQDTLLVFQEIRGSDPRDPPSLMTPYPRIAPAGGVRGWRIGVPRGAFEGRGERCKTVLTELEALGVKLVEVDLPDYPVDEMMIVLTAEAGAAFDDFSRGEDDDAMVRQERYAWPNTFRHARLIPAVDYIRANRLRAGLVRDVEAVFDTGLRAIVHPSFASGLLPMTNLSGHPTLVAPCGFDEGKPYSICFTGALYDEETLTELASAWQSATDWDDRHPDL
jgi:Asp-tRNA(Asn)/Glu-tRNA(Gln) amidotransferase A subunit family amidase